MGDPVTLESAASPGVTAVPAVLAAENQGEAIESKASKYQTAWPVWTSV